MTDSFHRTLDAALDRQAGDVEALASLIADGVVAYFKSLPLTANDDPEAWAEEHEIAKGGQALWSARAVLASGRFGHVLTTHADPEEYARIFNEGYEAAMTQHLADDPSAADDWYAARLAEARAAERERIAQAIEAEADPKWRGTLTGDGLRQAARIARSEAGA